MREEGEEGEKKKKQKKKKKEERKRNAFKAKLEGVKCDKKKCDFKTVELAEQRAKIASLYVCIPSCSPFIMRFDRLNEKMYEKKKH